MSCPNHSSGAKICPTRVYSTDCSSKSNWTKTLHLNVLMYSQLLRKLNSWTDLPHAGLGIDRTSREPGHGQTNGNLTHACYLQASPRWLEQSCTSAGAAGASTGATSRTGSNSILSTGTPSYLLPALGGTTHSSLCYTVQNEGRALYYINFALGKLYIKEFSLYNRRKLSM